MVVTPSGIVMLVNPVHSVKTLRSNKGVVIFVMLVQPEKALSGMVVTLAGIVMLVNPVQPEKALRPIEVTLSGIVMLVKPVQSLKA